jgi:peptidoglycan/LPS O-acetylase OafA/YrhL
LIKPTRFPALDGLRGLSVLGVLANHLGLQTPPESIALYPLYWFSEAGWIGVDVFFVLSGFLITGILMTNREAPNYFGAFYAHRALRILPLYYGLLFTIFVVSPLVNPAIGSFAGQSRSYWLFYSNAWILRDLGLLSIYWIPVLSPTWSLAVEEQFYIAWSLAVRFLPVRRLVTIAVLIIPLGMALRCALLEWSTWNVPQYLSRISFFTLTHLDGLCVGVLLSIAVRYNRTDIAIRFARLWWLFIAGASTIFIADHALAPKIPNSSGPIMLRVGLTVVALAAGSVVAHGLLIDGWVRKLFDGKAISRIGVYSYCIYLFHLPIAATLLWLFPSAKSTFGPVGLFAAETSLTIAFAAASFRFFESPIRSRKNRYPYWDAAEPSIPERGMEMTTLPSK